MRNPILTAILLSGLVLSVRCASAADARMRSYLCDSGSSTVTFTTRTTFVTVHGVARAPACTVWVDSDTTAFRIHATVPVRNFKSGISKRDTHVMKAVEADKFPWVDFTSASVKPEAGKVGPYSLTGTLNFHGETRSIETKAKPVIKNGKAEIQGGFPISLKEYKVTPPPLPLNKVKDSVSISFDLVFDLSGAKSP